MIVLNHSNKIVLKNVLLCLLLMVIATSGLMAQAKAENLIIITLDGLRWQEVFEGMDPAIANNEEYNQGDSTYIYDTYWAEDVEERREELMPFLWNTIAEEGQIYGNRMLDNKINNANPYWFSYPGYSELFTGFVDEEIDSNSDPNNPNLTLLTYLNRQPDFKNKIAVFSAWNAFNRILNEPEAGFPVFAAFDGYGGENPTPKEELLDNMLDDSIKPWHEGESLDLFPHYAAIEYLKTEQPKILYIAYGTTDTWAHAGKYRYYLDAAHQIDEWIGEIWAYVQHHPAYKDKTALLITVDHGRGDKVKSEWISHGSEIEGADETWFAVMGPGIAPKGEIEEDMQLYQKQLTQTMARILGITFKADHPIADPVEVIWED